MLRGASRLDAQALARSYLRIGDVSISLVSDESDLQFQLGRAARSFLVAEVGNRTPDIRLTADLQEPPAEARGEKLFDSGALWQLYRENGSYIFRFASAVLGKFPYKAARLNSDFTAGRISLHPRFFQPGHAVDPLEYPLDELLILHFLSRGVGIEVHACGVADENGNGFLFAGQSGAGKTTMARLWEKQASVTVLSDDRIILRKKEGRIWIYGTPWHGDARLASPGGAPLTRLCFLGHGNGNKLARLSRIDAASQLLARSFLPFYSREGLRFPLAFCEEAASEVSCYDFSFTPDESAVEFVRERS